MSSSGHRIAIAHSEADLQRCWPIMQELRPHLSEAEFLQQVKRQIAQGYCLAFVETGGSVVSVAGYRISEALAWGKFLYVDDLVTRGVDRSKGYGAALIDWLIALAQREGCAQFHLDSGVQRFGAHRFYLSKRMDITSHHFALKLPVGG